MFSEQESLERCKAVTSQPIALAQVSSTGGWRILSGPRKEHPYPISTLTWLIKDSNQAQST